MRSLISTGAIKKFVEYDVSLLAAEPGNDHSVDAARAMELLMDLDSAEQREVMILRYKFQLDYPEISEITGKSRPALRKLHERAVKQLRLLMK